jgi:hypothetical protein
MEEDMNFKTIAAFASVLALGVACGDKDDSGSDGSSGGGSACENYVDAWSQCVEEFGGNAADYGLTEGYCDAYTDSSYDSLLNCYADAISAGDCSTVEGYTEAANEAAMCTG